MTREELKLEIKQVVINSVEKYIKNYIKKKHTFHPLDYLITKERKIRSIVGGIETSMGRTLWEPLAKEIARSNHFIVVKDQLKKPQDELAHLGKTIEIIISDRINKTGLSDVAYINKTIKAACDRFKDRSLDLIPTSVGLGVDIWLKKGDTNYLFDIKTVQPNLAKFTSLFHQLVNWYGYFYIEHPLEKMECRIVFPYNPYGAKDFWVSSKGKGLPLEPHNEAWVGNEFWDFISGHENTLEIIFAAFQEVKAEKTLYEDFLLLFR